MGKLGIMTLTLQVACVFDPTPRPYPFKRLFRVPVTEERLGMPQGLPRRSQKMKTSVPPRQSSREVVLGRVLARARELAGEVRETAERVHQQAKESHRLTEMARHQAERGRELSKAGREEARDVVVDWLKWQVDVTANGKRRRSRPDET
jgi:hypothetical protein